MQLPVGECVEVPLKRSTLERWKLWVTRGDRWVATVAQGVGRRHFLNVTNVSPHALILHENTKVGMWLTKDQVPRAQGFVSLGSRRYAEWLNLAYESTTDRVDHTEDLPEEEEGPLVETPQYKTTYYILQRQKGLIPVMNVSSLPMSEEEEGPLEERPLSPKETIQEQSFLEDFQTG